MKKPENSVGYPQLWQVKVDINALDEDEQKAVQRLIRKIFQVLSCLGRKDREIIRAIYVERLTDKVGHKTGHDQ